MFGRKLQMNDLLQAFMEITLCYAHRRDEKVYERLTEDPNE